MAVFFADTHFATVYEKYRRYLRRYSKSVADTIGTNTNTAILTTPILRLYYNDCNRVVARSHWPCDKVATYVPLVEQPNRRGSQINHAASRGGRDLARQSAAAVTCMVTDG